MSGAATHRHRVPSVALAITLGLGLIWLAPGIFAPQSPVQGDLLARLQPPGAAHLFGTDQLGRDIWARTVHGLGQTLQAGLLAVAISFAGGVLLGTLAGVAGRLVDAMILRFNDLLLAIPTLILVLLLIAGLSRDTAIIAVAVGIAGIPRFTGLMRAEVLRIRATDYVEAARIAGTTSPRVVAGHILPNALPAALAILVVEFAHHLLIIASFTFLGLGTPGPQPELGLILSEGRNYLATAWWITTLPGAVFVLLVLSLSLAGRRLLHGTR